MFNHDEYYSSYWWIYNKDDWLNISLIAAPLMIVFGLALLITHEACSKWHRPLFTHHVRVYIRYSMTPCMSPQRATVMRLDARGPAGMKAMSWKLQPPLWFQLWTTVTISPAHIASYLATPDTYNCGLLSVSYSFLPVHLNRTRTDRDGRVTPGPS